MHQESRYELDRRHAHRFLFAAVFVILVAEGHGAVIVHAEQSLIRNRDAMRVSGEISKQFLGPTKRSLRVDVPFLGQRVNPSCELVRVCKVSGLTTESKFPLSISPLQRTNESFAKERTHHIDVNEELFFASLAHFARNPPLAIGRNPTPSHNAVDMRMCSKCLSPSMEDCQDSNFRTQVLGVGSQNL